MLTEALASAGGTALVTAMVTDGWEDIKAHFARLLGRGEPEETEAAARRLDESKAALASVPQVELERVRAEQEVAWRTRLADLLEQDPDAARELRSLIVDLQAHADGNVINTISGGTQHGPVLLGRDFTGLTFNTVPAAPPVEPVQDQSQ